MNPKIVVDHELFTTCRLCLEEKGKYQIVPAIQENIKFVFDIEVELNNGLPQLICAECESLLSNFVCTKQLFQEKQKALKNKIYSRDKPEKNTTIPASASKQRQQTEELLSSNSDEEDCETEQETVFVTDVISVCGKNIKKIIKKRKKTRNKSWRSLFVKQFGCRFCSKKFKKKDEIDRHLETHNKNITKPCFVSLEKFDNKQNITGSTKFVALNECKVLKNKKYYYIVYLHKSNYQSDSSADEINISRKKAKIPRIDSESSVDTLLLDESEQNETDVKEDDETKTLDSTPKLPDQTKSEPESDASLLRQADKLETISVAIDTLITACYNKLLKKIDTTNNTSKNTTEKSHLRHKVLSIGSKIINSNPVNCNGILRYLEYKNLEVNFINNESNENNYVRIHAKLKCKKEKSNNNTNNWKNVTNTPMSQSTADFFDILNGALTTETVEDKTTSSPQLFSKLLNACPVPNPKKLPKKNEESNLGVQKTLESGNGFNCRSKTNTNENILITNGSQDSSSVDVSNGNPPISLPRIKVKPASELMPERKQDRSAYPQPYPQQYARYSGPAARARGTPAAPDAYVPHYTANQRTTPQYVNMASAPVVTQPLSQIGNTMTNGTSGGTSFVRNPEHLILHTVEYPNTSTPSPFNYFKNLLQLYSINLLESKSVLTSDFRCLIKFKLNYQQDNALNVCLCLSLFSNVTSFCIQVVNHEGIDIDIRNMPANWQWEILKAFKNEVVPKLFMNAQNISQHMHNAVQKFIYYLKSIQVIMQ